MTLLLCPIAAASQPTDPVDRTAGFEDAYRKSTEDHGADHPRSLQNALLLALQLASTGQRDRAISLARETTVRAVNALGAEDPLTLEVRLGEIKILAALGQTEAASDLLAPLEQAADRVLAADHPMRRDITVLGTLLSPGGSQFGDVGPARMAEILEEQYQDIIARHGADAPQTMQSALALTLQLAGGGLADRTRARDLAAETLARASRVLDPNDPLRLRIRLVAALTMESTEETLQLLEVLARDAAQTLPAGHPLREQIATARVQGLAIAGRGDDANAVLAEAEAGTPGGATSASSRFASRVIIARNTADGRVAEQSLRALMAEAAEQFGPDSTELADTAIVLATRLGEDQRHAAALPFVELGHDILVRRLGPDHPSSAAAGALRRVLEAQRPVGPGETSRIAAAREVLKQRIDSFGPGDGRTFVARLQLIHALLETDADANTMAQRMLAPWFEEADGDALKAAERARLAEALQLAVDGLAQAAELYGTDGDFALLFEYTVADVLSQMGNHADALVRADRLLALTEAPATPDLRLTGFDLREPLGGLRSRSLLALGRPGEALPALRARSAAALARLALDSLAARADADAVRAAQIGTWQHIHAAYDLARQREARTGDALTPADAQDAPVTLMDEAFGVFQAEAFGGTGQAIARATLRNSADRAGFGAVLQAREAAVATRDRLMASFSATAAHDGDTLRRVADDIAAEEHRIAALGDRLATGFPQIAAHLTPPPMTISEVQARLGPHEALVVLGQFGGYEEFPGVTWVVTRDRASWSARPVPPEQMMYLTLMMRDQVDPSATPSPGSIADAEIAALRAPVSGRIDPAPDSGGPATRGFNRTLARVVHQVLFGAPEIAPLLADKTHWILVPQGALSILPFAALVTGEVTGEDTDPQALRETPWLGRERALSILPTVASLRLSERPRRADPDRLAYLGLGDPSFIGTARPLRAGRTASVRQLPRLPATAIEVARVAGSYPQGETLVLTGADASEAQLAKLADTGRLAGVDVLHFATHGLLAGEVAGLAEPALALSPPADAPLLSPTPQGDDGLLTATEIAGLSLDADWVVLSACNTAGGADGGLTGLARAFFYAGARSLLVSQWVVRDDVAARLTIETVGQSTAEAASLHPGGGARAEALRRAMALIIDDASEDGRALPLSHPALWAPFQIVGR